MECLPVEVGGLTGLDLDGRLALLDALVNLRGALHAGSEGEGERTTKKAAPVGTAS
jgi:hypothetical protein